MSLYMAENVLLSHELQRPLPKTADPRVQIAGNFAPIPNQSVKNSLPVDGTIPSCINDAYLRNDVNHLFESMVGHHLFDGDSVVHAITIDNGNASYACQFTDRRKNWAAVFSLKQPASSMAIRGLIGFCCFMLEESSALSIINNALAWLYFND
ncbi:hypothetical protein V6N13_130637 [Hibiscus sabdariffa]|uniref:Uncharacterized protein n=2 Tax=Hibiscus sabdariffa TaxID=183260 RepID=A0ABR2P0Q9_9ROSI